MIRKITDRTRRATAVLETLTRVCPTCGAKLHDLPAPTQAPWFWCPACDEPWSEIRLKQHQNQ